MHLFTLICGKYLFVLGPLLVVGVWLRSNPSDRRSLGLRVVAMLLLCAAFALLAGSVYYDTRPFARLHTPPLMPYIASNGFPSTQTLVVAGCALLLPRYSWGVASLLGVATLLVGYGRVASLLHTPTDVVGSIVIAIVAALGSAVLVRRRPKNGKGADNVAVAPPARKTASQAARSRV